MYLHHYRGGLLLLLQVALLIIFTKLELPHAGAEYLHGQYSLHVPSLLSTDIAGISSLRQNDHGSLGFGFHQSTQQARAITNSLLYSSEQISTRSFKPLYDNHNLEIDTLQTIIDIDDDDADIASGQRYITDIVHTSNDFSSSTTHKDITSLPTPDTTNFRKTGTTINLVLGGYDYSMQRAILTSIYPHGSMDVVPYTALGSRSLAATGVLESRYAHDITIEDAVTLVKDAVRAGITNDLGSGSNVDLCIISSSGVTYRRGVAQEEDLCHHGSTAFEAELQQQQQQPTENREEDRIVDGINGFGSLPYTIKSHSILFDDEETIRKRKQEWLEQYLQI